MTAMGLLEAATELGVRVVQFGPNHGLQDLPEERRSLVAAMARERGLELELGAKGLEPERLIPLVKLTRQCGASFLRTVPAERPGGELPGLAQMEESLRQVLPALAGEGVTLAIENALVPARQLRSLIETLASPWVGITLDTVNSLAISEGFREVAETLAPYTRCLHVKDYTVARQWHMMGFQVEGRPAGQGQLDVPWLLALLAKHGASANAIVESWVPEQASLDETVALERRWARESVAYLRTLIPE
jgi:sugar phosphate isomerase/epimerase